MKTSYDNMIKRRGFTLVEVLIVVIIIAVLAALILPRLLNQTENAYIGEAQRTLGMLRKAELNIRSTNGAFVAVVQTEVVNGGTNMALLGLQPISAANWNYLCDGTGLCSARRLGNLANIISLDADTGTWNCSPSYKLISPSKGVRAA